MRRKAKFEPINHVDTLGFAPSTWEVLASAHAKGLTPPRFIIPVSMQPLLARNSKFNLFTRAKIQSYITLMHSYFPQTPIEFLMCDTLYLKNHPQPGARAEAALTNRKKEWTELLGLPVDNLSADRTSISTTFHFDPAFRETAAPAISPESKQVTLSSWAHYETDELSRFMKKTQDAVAKILLLDNPATILLDDSRLFAADHLAFVKEKLESIITKDLGYQGTETDQFKEFIGTFSLTAMHHLRKLHDLKAPMCRANAGPSKLTAVKMKLFEQAPADTRLAEYTASFCHLVHEFCYFAGQLLTSPRASGIPDNTPLHLYYASGMPYAPVYHPVNQLNYFLEVSGLSSRGFLACAEFSPRINNNDHSSSHGEITMKDRPPSTQAPSQQPTPPHAILRKVGTDAQAATPSPTDAITPSSASSGPTGCTDYTSTTDDEPPSGSSASSSVASVAEAEDAAVFTMDTPEAGHGAPQAPGAPLLNLTSLQMQLTMLCLQHSDAGTVQAAVEMWKFANGMGLPAAPAAATGRPLTTAQKASRGSSPNKDQLPPVLAANDPTRARRASND